MWKDTSKVHQECKQIIPHTLQKEKGGRCLIHMFSNKKGWVSTSPCWTLRLYEMFRKRAQQNLLNNLSKCLLPTTYEKYLLKKIWQILSLSIFFLVLYLYACQIFLNKKVIETVTREVTVIVRVVTCNASKVKVIWVTY